ncbi:MAG TPA: alanine racemase [Solirubrobacteraceae bacterium]|nr:alanine racemase [Solirubrobacteraceae bacterium]
MTPGSETSTGQGEASSTRRRALARVNLAAIERNCQRLREELRQGCELCVVVKADAYGHGAAQSARAALDGGASWLAVAGASEATQLRRFGFGDVRLLVMGALSPVELKESLAAKADVVVWSEQMVVAVARAGGGRVHVKLDSGMGRLGTRDPEQGLRVAALAAATAKVELAGAMTHFATADDERDQFFGRQLESFSGWAEQLKRSYPQIVVHAANSAAALREPRAHFDMVRCGIGVYGMDPFAGDPRARGLDPALELVSYVAEVKDCAPGQSAGYGRRFVAEQDTTLGVLPIGYGDGWRRALSNNGEVLIAGRRRPIVGTVSMDNLTVDLGAEAKASDLRGGEAVLIGVRGDQRITAEEVARRIGTINYEVTCALTGRVPRVYHRDGQVVDTQESGQTSDSLGAAGQLVADASPVPTPSID